MVNRRHPSRRVPRLLRWEGQIQHGATRRIAVAKRRNIDPVTRNQAEFYSLEFDHRRPNE
jgi:hypothetical protein